MIAYQTVELGRVIADHIPDIGLVFQSSFNLEGCGTGIKDLLQHIILAQVFERQQVSLVFNDFAVGIFQVKFHAAELRTFATVGTAAETML